MFAYAPLIDGQTAEKKKPTVDATACSEVTASVACARGAQTNSPQLHVTSGVWQAQHLKFTYN